MIAMHEDKALIIGQVVLFLTTLAGFFFQLFREGRNRKWEIEDRAATRLNLTNAAHEVKETLGKAAHDVKSELEKSATKAAEDRKEIAESVSSQIKENMNISTKAFEVGNHVNDKILDLEKGTKAVNQRIEDLIKVFDVAGKPEVKMEAKSVVINTEHATLDKKLEGHAEQ